ncbi:DUF4917 family protein [Photobacterium phosphoreum]|uniref:DUF4917 family protein n=1 Tax=Photobacterium phosphoreum TaxID=659 RepID=UPI00242E6FCF|nr:DUF4917 family protein [Photobacterium phosphoreum]
MPELEINENIVHWNELSEFNWKNLLIGNGFSINIWEKFGYGSLFDLAKSNVVDEKLTTEGLALFDHLQTSNFEDVLRVLYHAKIVDDQLGSPQSANIQRLYENTKKSLGAAVNYTHIPPNTADVSEINRQLRGYNNVFTTNYDLIPYWAVMETETWRFKDYFWGEGNSFNISDTDIYTRCTKLYYLHGAIHLAERNDGKTLKLTANGLHRLTQLFDLDNPEQFPLFISEGSSEWKLSRINRNDYLRFCYEKLIKMKGKLVVLGHSLHKDYDQHIIDAINKSNVTTIAISVWPLLSNEEIVSFKSRLSQCLKDKKLYFFDSYSHPLGSLDLNEPMV